LGRARVQVQWVEAVASLEVRTERHNQHLYGRVQLMTTPASAVAREKEREGGGAGALGGGVYTVHQTRVPVAEQVTPAVYEIHLTNSWGGQ
jgi:hypothetical protein